MITISILKNDIHIADKSIEASDRIRNIIKEIHLENETILSYKINNKEYKNENFKIRDDSEINLITYKHLEGKRIYQDSLIFIMTKAVYNIFSRKVQVVVEHSIDDGVYCELFGIDNLSNEIVNNIKKEMLRIIAMKMSIEKVSFDWNAALDIFNRQGRKDLRENLQYYSLRDIDLYRCGEYYDFYARPLADNTSNVSIFDLKQLSKGFILKFPQQNSLKINKCLVLSEKVFNAHQEIDKWLNILDVHNVVELNETIDNYEISNFILHEEALQEKKIAQISDKIIKSNTRLILIAGPSASGKTSFSHRLSVQLTVSGVKPVVLGLDNYFLDKEITPRLPNGDYDFESIKTINLKLLNENLKDLLNGKEVELPKYNFSRGISEKSGNFVKLHDKNVIIMEGIHGLNPALTEQIPDKDKVKIYVTALNQLNIDNHNRIPTTDFRKLRRATRDMYQRGYSVDETLSRWQSIRDGEEKNIFPFQENADIVFNSSLTYELGCLKSHIYKELMKISPLSKNYTEAQRLIILLSFIRDIPERYVPNNSLLKEFIGGSIFFE